MDDILPLLDQCNEDEYLKECARRAMDDFRGFSLARPTQDHVDVRKAMMRTRIEECLKAARKKG